VNAQRTVQSSPFFGRREFLGVATAALIAGCSDAERKPKFGRRIVQLTDVPETVMEAAKRELPDVEFTDAWKNVDQDGKLHSYEIRGKNKNGKTREARVSPSGEILETE
jgi:hypothetical protein